MSNDPFGRAITNFLNPYWENHPNQRDAVHGFYHNAAGHFWNFMGDSEKANADFKRRDDHWIRHENGRGNRSRSNSR